MLEQIKDRSKNVMENIVVKFSTSFYPDTSLFYPDTTSSREQLEAKFVRNKGNALIVVLLSGSLVGVFLALSALLLPAISYLTSIATVVADSLYSISFGLSLVVIPVAGLYAAKPLLELNLVKFREKKLEIEMEADPVTSEKIEATVLKVAENIKEKTIDQLPTIPEIKKFEEDKLEDKPEITEGIKHRLVAGN